MQIFPLVKVVAFMLAIAAQSMFWIVSLLTTWQIFHGGAATLEPGASLCLTNTLISSNSTTTGNANVSGINGNVTMVNSTVVDNNPQGAQAVILWSGNLTITNSILWNNAFNLQGDSPCSACFTVTYADIEGGFTGTGNINADPLFVGAGYYRLQWGSPGIDAGTDLGAPDHDLDQVKLPQDGNGIAITILWALMN